MHNIAIWHNAKILTLADDKMADTLVVVEDKIKWVGHHERLPEQFKNANSQYIDANQRCITPGLIDCHTHLIYAGNRLEEFILKQEGKSYQEITQQGLGIYSTVHATRKASEHELFDQSAKRLTCFLQEGITTIEIKSGYGLDFVTERKMLKVAQALEKAFPVDIVKTYLGPHLLPKEYPSNDAYIKDIVEKFLPKLIEENLIDGVDSFCDQIAFSPSDLATFYQAAQAFSLIKMCHADQLTNIQGAQFAAKFSVQGVSHLEYADEDGIQALKEAGSVAILLPGAFYYLKEQQRPPIDLFRKYQIPMAISTDCNPGTSPTCSLLLMLNMACVLFGLTPFEALQGVTVQAAKALGLEKTKGKLLPDYDADFVLWDVSHPSELVYCFGVNPCYQVIKNGNLIYEKIDTL